MNTKELFKRMFAGLPLKELREIERALVAAIERKSDAQRKNGGAK